MFCIPVQTLQSQIVLHLSHKRRRLHTHNNNKARGILCRFVRSSCFIHFALPRCSASVDLALASSSYQSTATDFYEASPQNKVSNNCSVAVELQL